MTIKKVYVDIILRRIALGADPLFKTQCEPSFAFNLLWRKTWIENIIFKLSWHIKVRFQIANVIVNIARSGQMSSKPSWWPTRWYRYGREFRCKEWFRICWVITKLRRD